MLTLFACPKSFSDPHIAMIQRNAIASWTFLRPRPEIILFGDEEGTEEISRRLKLRHLPDVLRNEVGTPLVDDIFDKARRFATHDLLGYVNADIILMDDFIKAVSQISVLRENFLMVGRRWDVEISRDLCFNQDQETEFLKKLLEEAKPCSPKGIDYFIFPKGFWSNIPPFALGRFWWDNWLLYRARSSGANLIDATPVVRIIHQKHSYSNLPTDNRSDLPAQLWFQNPEARHNYRLAGGKKECSYQILDSTHRFTPYGIKRSWGGTFRLCSAWASWGQPWVERGKRYLWLPFLSMISRHQSK